MSKYSLQELRHSAAHLLAQAIDELFPGTLFTIGPATETGFFYDILPKENLKFSDLEVITLRMKEIVKRDLSINHYHIPKIEAKDIFKNNKFKIDIIENQINEDVAGIAKQGDFLDLCKGGHVKSTKELNNFILTGISGSYWRGNREGDALQRISGIIFHTKEELDNYLKIQDELEKYDHRKLGQEMDLFSFHNEGPGFPFFHPKGMIIVNTLQKYMRKITNEAGYLEVRTPTMLSCELWKQSGHYKHYKDNMYTCFIDEHEYAIKPMNCPGAFIIYNSRPRSYRELPLRLSEFGHVHRHELSGALHGLMRVRSFTQDDAHIICSMDQIENEIISIMNSIDKMSKKTGLKTGSICISTRPEKASGNEDLWERAIKMLVDALNKENRVFEIKEGDGAFYGPKIEIKIKDIFNREWTCGTIQLDFIQPENFDMTFVNSNGQKERPVVIHQAIYGSIERTVAILLEHHKGKLPAWLNPIQVKIVTITDAQKDYAMEIYNLLNKEEVRVEVDFENDPLNGKLQRAIKEKVSFVIVLGNKEVQNRTVSIRDINGNQKNGLSLENAITEIVEECK